MGTITGSFAQSASRKQVFVGNIPDNSCLWLALASQFTLMTPSGPVVAAR